MAGWIKLHRQLMESDMWQKKPFSRGQAWVDLLMMANHKERDVLFDGRFITVERGSFITSELKLMDRWGWSKSKTRLFLKELEKQSMIDKKTDRKKTTLTICNYSVYQDSETTEEPLKDHRKTTERPLKDTNKNVKNVKNEKNGYVPPKKRKDMTIEKENKYTEEELQEMLLKKGQNNDQKRYEYQI